MLLADKHMESDAVQLHKLYCLVRTDAVEKSKYLSQLLIERCKKHNIKISYDVTYGQHPDHLRYSEFFAGLGGISISPCCGKLLKKMFALDYQDVNQKNYAEYISGTPDKYIVYDYDITNIDSLVILPGSNLLRTTIDKAKLNSAVVLGAKIKPHPLTNDEDIKRLEEYSDRGNIILPRMYSGFKAMQASNYIFASGTTELALYAMLLNKRVIDIGTGNPRGAYFDIFQHVVNTSNQGDALNKILNNPASGVIMPDNKKRIDEYLEIYRAML